MRKAYEILEEYRKQFPKAQIDLIYEVSSIQVVCICRNHRLNLGRYSDGMRLHVAACMKAIEEYEEKGELFQEIKNTVENEFAIGREHFYKEYSTEDFLKTLIYRDISK